MLAKGQHGTRGRNRRHRRHGKERATTRAPRPLSLFAILGEGRGLMPGAKGRTSIEGGAQIDEIAR